MTAYVIFICDKKATPENHAQYRALAPLAPNEGVKLLAGNGPFEVVEGPPAQNVVILSYPTIERAREWYFSPEYQAAVKHRSIDATYRVILIDDYANNPPA